MTELKSKYMQNNKQFDKIENISFIKELTLGFSKKIKKFPLGFIMT